MDTNIRDRQIMAVREYINSRCLALTRDGLMHRHESSARYCISVNEAMDAGMIVTLSPVLLRIEGQVIRL
jgi:hypothetical protein